LIPHWQPPAGASSRVQYHDSIADAVADLGKPEEIGQVFAGFQKFLYQGAA
jgi:type I restriction enzyme, R subunit